MSKIYLKRISNLIILTVFFCFSMVVSTMAQQLPSKALTVDGNAEAIDVTNDEGKEFLTVQSRNGNIFYIIIDHQKEENNVYFLNAVDEVDLLSFATDATGNNYHLTGSEVTTEITTEITTETTTEIITEVVVEPVQNKSSGGFAFAMGILIICLVVILYFLLKKKLNKNNEADDEDEEFTEEANNSDSEVENEDYDKYLNSDNGDDEDESYN